MTMISLFLFATINTVFAMILAASYIKFYEALTSASTVEIPITTDRKTRVSQLFFTYARIELG